MQVDTWGLLRLKTTQVKIESDVGSINKPCNAAVAAVRSPNQVANKHVERLAMAMIQRSFACGDAGGQQPPARLSLLPRL